MNRFFAGVSEFFRRHFAVLGLVILLLLALLNLLQIEVIHSLQTLGIRGHKTSCALICDGAEPAVCGGLDDSNRGYVRISLDFLATTTDGNPNLFQTDRLNDGIRAEFAGSTLALVFPCEAAANHLKGVPIAEGLELGRWHHLEFEALDGSFLNCHVSGYSPFRSRRDRPHFSARDVRVGTGFDSSRRFHGDVRNVTVATLNGRSLRAARTVSYALQVVLLIAFGMTLCIYYLQAPAIVAPAAGTRPVAIGRSFYDPLLTLRFTACLMVLAGHALMVTHLPANLPNSLAAGSAAWLLTASPWGGVWIFFTLSGYLMGKGFYSGRYTPDGTGVWSFYRNRLLRIIPLYFTSVVIVAALVHPECFARANLGHLLAVLSFQCDSFDSDHPIGALWSVRTEMQFYAIVPFIYICVARHLKSLAAISAIAAAALAGGLVFRNATIRTLGWEFWPVEIYRTLLGNIDMFLWGFLLNPLLQRLKHRSTDRKYLLELGFVLLGATYVGLAWVSARGGLLLIPAWRSFLFAVGPTLTALATSGVIACFETGRIDPHNIVVRLGKRTELLGLITYALYVWHEPILLMAARSQPRPETLAAALQSLSATFAVVFVVSLIMYYSIERPFERRKSYGRSPESGGKDVLRIDDFARHNNAPESAIPVTEIRRAA
jgi:peptidoglycan/LPS O-acetylase OafA/YrhL